MPKSEIRRWVDRSEQTDVSWRWDTVQPHARKPKSVCPQSRPAEPWHWRLTSAWLNWPSLCCRAAHQFRTLAPRFASTRSCPTIAPATCSGRLVPAKPCLRSGGWRGPAIPCGLVSGHAGGRASRRL